MRSTTSDGRERRCSVCVFADDSKIRFCFAALSHCLARHALIVYDHDIHLGPEALATLGLGDNSFSIGSLISAVHSSRAVGPAVKDASAPNCTARRSRTLFKPMPLGPPVHPLAVVLITRNITAPL